MTNNDLEECFKSWQSTAQAPEALVERTIAKLPTRSQSRRTLPLFLTTAAVAVGIAGYFYNEQHQGRWQFEQVVHALEKAHDVRWVDRLEGMGSWKTFSPQALHATFSAPFPAQTPWTSLSPTSSRPIPEARSASEIIKSNLLGSLILPPASFLAIRKNSGK